MLNRRDFNFGVGSVLGIGISLPFVDWNGLFEPVPYKNVEVVMVRKEGNFVEFVANFEKTDCKFVELVPVGQLFNTTKPLFWQDLQTGKKDVDRLKGKQTLHIRIRHEDMDTIEIRLRHQCGLDKDGLPKYIDEVFYTINMLEFK